MSRYRRTAAVRMFRDFLEEGHVDSVSASGQCWARSRGWWAAQRAHHGLVPITAAAAIARAATGADSACTPGARIPRQAIVSQITFKDIPPPYRENDNDGIGHRSGSQFQNTTDTTPCEVLDLLANCRITSQADDYQESDVEYAEIQDMGLWHSTPLAKRHKPKISLTWVLKENLENTKIPPQKIQNEDKTNSVNGNDVDRQQRHNQMLYEREQYRKCKSGEVRDRVMGRNEHYLRFRNACEEFVNGPTTCSDTSVGTEEYMRRKHKHRHRRKKKHSSTKFGYDIRDLDSFLTEASIDRPGNIPVVVAYPTTLYQTQKDSQRELTLPLGTVVNAVFKNQLWLYVQTPHGEEGYVLYSACLPLGILPNRTPERKTPCWESSTDIYPRPCGNLTDTEKEQLRGKTRSECHYKTRSDKREKKHKNLSAEKDFDNLYLRTKSVCSNIDRVHEKENVKVKRQTLLVVSSDYKGSDSNKTLSVQHGDVVTLVRGGLDGDNSDWFYVKKKDGSLGYIPAEIAGHGYI